MINKSMLALIAAVAAAGIASPAFAQAWDNAIGTGNTLPMVYDAHGGKHRFTFGYSGPLWPAMPAQNDKVAARQSSPDKTAVRQNDRVQVGSRLNGIYDYSGVAGALHPDTNADNPGLTGGGSSGYNENLRTDQW